MNKDVAVALENLLRERGDPPDDDLLFPGKDGGLIDPDALSAAFTIARDAAGVTNKLPLKHTRHTHCSQLAARGVHITKIKEFAGHVTIMTTMHYMAFAPSDDDADTVDHAFEATKTPVESSEPTDSERLTELQRQVSELSEQLREALTSRVA